MQILFVEDDARLATSITKGLVEEKHEVTHVRDGLLGLQKLTESGFDVCILDVLLPKMDGFTVITRARAIGITTPVLFLTARDSVADRVEGLRRGGDDYLVKPFAFAELLARIDALARRTMQRESRLCIGGIELDSGAHRARVGERELELSQKQFALLEFMMRHAGQVVTRAMILTDVFGYRFDPGTNIVDVHVGNLRHKLASCGIDGRIATVRGVGYRFEADAP